MSGPELHIDQFIIDRCQKEEADNVFACAFMCMHYQNTSEMTGQTSMKRAEINSITIENGCHNRLTLKKKTTVL